MSGCRRLVFNLALISTPITLKVPFCRTIGAITPCWTFYPSQGLPCWRYGSRWRAFCLRWWLAYITTCRYLNLIVFFQISMVPGICNIANTSVADGLTNCRSTSEKTTHEHCCPFVPARLDTRFYGPISSMTFSPAKNGVGFNSCFSTLALIIIFL